jgi:hypothetical protein
MYFARGQKPWVQRPFSRENNRLIVAILLEESWVGEVHLQPRKVALETDIKLGQCVLECPPFSTTDFH